MAQSNLENQAYSVAYLASNRDIQLWSNGNLSARQKQRIQLARAIYSDSDVHSLDDIFSPVDAHTRAHLFQKYLMQILSHKTC